MKWFKRYKDYGFFDQDIRLSKLSRLLDEKDKGEPFYTDGAYTGEPQKKIIASKEMINRVCEKGYRNNPLTEQKDQNTEKSRIRSRVEQVFGFMENSMNGMYLCNIGLKRLAAVVGLMNLTYNMYRKLQLQLL